MGPSGSGKSTVALGLVRQGWGYLSDDAVLLRAPAQGVDAPALRQPFSIDARTAEAYADLPLGEAPCASAGGRKRRVCVAEAYPAQHVTRCCPRLLLFAQVVPEACSSLQALERLQALQGLLTQSGPPLFDRHTMASHFAVLARLVQQPGRLGALLAAVEGDTSWHAS